MSFCAWLTRSTPSHVRVMWKMKPSRRCSPSVRRSRPIFSCSRNVTIVASSCAWRSSSPSSLKVTRLRSVWASHTGRGKLPMLVVAIGPSFILRLPPEATSFLVQAVDIAALVELGDEARVIEIVRLVHAHLAVVVDVHHQLDALDRRIGLGRQLHRLRIDMLLRAGFLDAVPFCHGGECRLLVVADQRQRVDG